jgi:hypothetical protein
MNKCVSCANWIDTGMCKYHSGFPGIEVIIASTDEHCENYVKDPKYKEPKV